MPVIGARAAHDASPFREAGEGPVEELGAVLLASSRGGVLLGLKGGRNSKLVWKKLQGFADRLNGAVEPGRSDAATVAEGSVVLAAQPRHLGSDHVGGQLLRLAIEGVDIVGDREVLIGRGAVRDLLRRRPASCPGCGVPSLAATGPPGTCRG